MDGPNVAYSAENALNCRNVVVWNVLTGSAELVSGPTPGTRCGDDEPTGQRVTALAVAGTQVAWIRNITGNTEADDALFTASLMSPHERRLASATRTSGAGAWIGGLVGSGNLVAVNTWTTNAAGAITKAFLRSIDGTALRTISAGPGTVVAESADLGRVAVLRANGTVAIYGPHGAPLTITPSSAREIALRKDYLVVLTRTKTLEIYNANTGAFIRKWPVPGGAAHLDVYAGIAVFSVWRMLDAVQLTTGKGVVLASLKRAIVADAIEAPGIVYAYDSVRGIKDFGNLGFLPMKTVSFG
jgi:hypothetical protein